MAGAIVSKEADMGELWVSNIQKEVSDDEIRKFLCGYGFPSFDWIQRIDGTGASPAALLGFDTVHGYALRNLQPRVHNLFWKNRRVTVQVLPERDEY
ncbi:hypothetical protein BX592_13813 [Paraburkholderia rhizosphaerae]|uniref:RNA recognition motif-containing protein n=3 Tax=Paraburkholderia rhizosphaerae TaxID=480658 RepID=A0A4R8L691_9BURK|nr:hypothetical protein BX592_13813 [Paraburkholderia rhizosphaerae]